MRKMSGAAFAPSSSQASSRLSAVLMYLFTRFASLMRCPKVPHSRSAHSSSRANAVAFCKASLGDFALCARS